MRKREETGNTKLFLKLRDTHLLDFEYSNELDNLLWKEKSDTELFEKIKKVKRESRMARDNSEDAVSWNVFRFLGRNNLIEGFLNLITCLYLESSEIIYWSYSQKEGFLRFM